MHSVLCVIISPLKFCFWGFSQQSHKIIIFFVCFLVFRDVIWSFDLIFFMHWIHSMNFFALILFLLCPGIINVGKLRTRWRRWRSILFQNLEENKGMTMLRPARRYLQDLSVGPSSSSHSSRTKRHKTTYCFCN